MRIRELLTGMITRYQTDGGDVTTSVHENKENFTQKTKYGQDITFQYTWEWKNPVLDKSWVYHRIDAYVDGADAGYLKFSYIPRNTFKTSIPSILAWYDIHAGTRLYPREGTDLRRTAFVKMTDEQLRSVVECAYRYLRISVSPIETNRKQLMKHIRELEKIVTQQAGKQYAKFCEYHIDKPEPDYILVRPDFKGIGVGRALYMAAGHWMAEHGLKFYQSTTQSDDAKNAWARLEKQGRAAKEGDRYYIIPENTLHEDH